MASNDRAGVVFGPDGRTVVFAGVDGSLAWWDLGQRTESHSLALDGFVVELAASADRARIATHTNPDDVARAWDVRTGHELRQMPYARLDAIAISRDGRYLATAGRDSETTTAIEVTEIRPDDAVAAACRRMERNLTRNEWRQYLGESVSYRETCPGLPPEGAE